MDVQLFIFFLLKGELYKLQHFKDIQENIEEFQHSTNYLNALKYFKYDNKCIFLEIFLISYLINKFKIFRMLMK